MNLKRIMLVIMMVCLASAVQAQGLDGHGQGQGNQHGSGRAQHWDFSMQTIYTGSEEFVGEGGSSLSLEDNLGWGFGISYHITENFNLGMNFNWSSINYTAIGVSDENPDEPQRYSNSVDLNTTLITAKWNFMKGPFTPYVSGSLGWTLVDTNIFAGYGSGCYWDPWWGYICGPVTTTYGTDAASYGLGLGARYELTPKFAVSASYDITWLDIDAVDSNNVFRFAFSFLH